MAVVKLPAQSPMQPEEDSPPSLTENSTETAPEMMPETVAEDPSESPSGTPPPALGVDRLDRQIAFVVGAIAFALYLRVLAPGLLAGDSGEFQFAAWQLGLAHPTGYPLYLIMGWFWQHALALVGFSPAWALNAFSALTAGVGVGLLYWIMAQWVPLRSPQRRIVGLYSATLLAINLTYWSQALIAEVYALHVVLMLALLLATHSLVRIPTLRRLLLVAALAGLALTHHAMSLLWLPALLLYWFRADWGWRRFSWWHWLLAIGAGLLPLLLYLYIPLRSGPEASPWYHQRLGDGTLTLYANNWASFWAFFSGQSIGVGFRTLRDALAQIPQAAWLWQYHLGWVGLVMMAAGLVWLKVTRRHAILIATLFYVIAQQLFNLFYNIGDILVYYIPLYLVGAIWAGFGMAALVTGQWSTNQTPLTSTSTTPPSNPPLPPEQGQGLRSVGMVVGIAILLLVMLELPITSEQIDQSTSTVARDQWEQILAADPPDNAILVSNDRNEIVPLFYLQTVEQRATGMTGLFPLIAPDPRFRDIGATLETALREGGDQPVYLIKLMPGLEIRFDLQPATPPLVQVRERATTPPSVRVDQPYGPLQLLGYDFISGTESIELVLHWQVNEPIAENYVATAQLLAPNDEKLAQADHLPGGDYYPTALWKVGDQLLVRHSLPLDSSQDSSLAASLPDDLRLLVSFYSASDFAPLAQPLVLPITP